MPELDYIPLFLDFYARYSELSYEERGRLVWAMLAYARGEDPAPHLTEELRRFCFPNEKDVIDRTARVHVERRERRRAAAQTANTAKYKLSDSEPIGANRRQSEAIGGNRSQSEPIGTNRSQSEHNNNNNNNNNHNNNHNHNDNKGGAADDGRPARGPGEAGRPGPVGREKIL